MLEAEEIVADLIAFFQPKVLAASSRRCSPPDRPSRPSIRFAASPTCCRAARWAYSIARAAQDAGAQVTLISGPVSQPTPRGVTRIDVVSALEMHAAVMQRAAAQDVFIGVAAVADYRLHRRRAQDQEGRIARASDRTRPESDILAEVAAPPTPPLCVGFAAETRNLAEYAQKKRIAKKIPLIVGNLNWNTGLGGDDDADPVRRQRHSRRRRRRQGLELARQLMARIATLLENR